MTVAASTQTRMCRSVTVAFLLPSGSSKLSASLSTMAWRRPKRLQLKSLNRPQAETRKALVIDKIGERGPWKKGLQELHKIGERGPRKKRLQGLRPSELYSPWVAKRVKREHSDQDIVKKFRLKGRRAAASDISLRPDLEQVGGCTSVLVATQLVSL